MKSVRDKRTGSDPKVGNILQQYTVMPVKREKWLVTVKITGSGPEITEIFESADSAIECHLKDASMVLDRERLDKRHKSSLIIYTHNNPFIVNKPPSATSLIAGNKISTESLMHNFIFTVP
ncbi:hypothetical protein AVEN_17006-1 [Araneus ventricosus]|uniref:Uncharacterized protein n=1 Tax=Araneus ventricosus TaxID=182803 RepID=A0A4Y2TAU2_ARAVE|nr:hypothetical protein AVEN_17006-1 [Araneus ventricosus]